MLPSKSLAIIVVVMSVAMTIVVSAPEPKPTGKNSTKHFAYYCDNSHEALRQNLITVGNHSFLPLEVTEGPEKQPRQILNLLKLFEDQHPELRVTRWSIEMDRVVNPSNPPIYGLWIDHEPKEMPPTQ